MHLSQQTNDINDFTVNTAANVVAESKDFAARGNSQSTTHRINATDTMTEDDIKAALKLTTGVSWADLDDDDEGWVPVNETNASETDEVTDDEPTKIEMTEEYIRQMLSREANWADLEDGLDGWCPDEAEDAYISVETRDIRDPFDAPRPTGNNAILLSTNVGGTYNTEPEAGFLVPIEQVYVNVGKGIATCKAALRYGSTGLRNSWTFQKETESSSDAEKQTHRARTGSQSTNETSEPKSPPQEMFATISVEADDKARPVASDVEATTQAPDFPNKHADTAPCLRHIQWTQEAETCGWAPWIEHRFAYRSEKTGNDIPYKIRTHYAPGHEPEGGVPSKVTPSKHVEVEPKGTPTAPGHEHVGVLKRRTAAAPEDIVSLSLSVLGMGERAILRTKAVVETPVTPIPILELKLGAPMAITTLPSQPVAKYVEGPEETAVVPPTAAFSFAMPRSQAPCTSSGVAMPRGPSPFKTALSSIQFVCMDEGPDTVTEVTPREDDPELESLLAPWPYCTETTTAVTLATIDIHFRDIDSATAPAPSSTVHPVPESKTVATTGIQACSEFPCLEVLPNVLSVDMPTVHTAAMASIAILAAPKISTQITTAGESTAMESFQDAEAYSELTPPLDHNEPHPRLMSSEADLLPTSQVSPERLIAVAVPMEQSQQVEAAPEKAFADLVAQTESAILESVVSDWRGRCLNNRRPVYTRNTPPFFPRDEAAQHSAKVMTLIGLGFAVLLGLAFPGS